MKVGDVVGNYVVDALAGEGGMSSVWVVRHRVLHARRALKVLRPELLARDTVRERFIAEGRVQAQLSHPGIVPVTDVVDEAGCAGLVMPLMAGGSLDDRMRARPRPELTVGTVLDVVRALASALQAAHRHGVVHCDVKPSNVLFADDGWDRPLLADFGVAKVLEEARVVGARADTTRAGTTLGTPGYMSPEQVRGQGRITPATDQFSLGVILWELLTGTSPFRGRSEFDLLERIAHGRRPSLDEVAPELPAALVEVVETAMSTDPADRYPSVRELADALERVGRRIDRSAVVQPHELGDAAWATLAGYTEPDARPTGSMTGHTPAPSALTTPSEAAPTQVRSARGGLPGAAVAQVPSPPPLAPDATSRTSLLPDDGPGDAPPPDPAPAGRSGGSMFAQLEGRPSSGRPTADDAAESPSSGDTASEPAVRSMETFGSAAREASAARETPADRSPTSGSDARRGGSMFDQLEDGGSGWKGPSEEEIQARREARGRTSAPGGRGGAVVTDAGGQTLDDGKGAGGDGLRAAARASADGPSMAAGGGNLAVVGAGCALWALVGVAGVAATLLFVDLPEARPTADVGSGVSGARTEDGQSVLEAHGYDFVGVRPEPDTLLGSPFAEPGRELDESQVKVTLTPFLIGTTEVTQAMWVDVMGEDPVATHRRSWGESGRGAPSCADFGHDDALPVHCITWHEAITFCNRLSEREGLDPVYEVTPDGRVRWDQMADGVRLPTEAEWELAARAGARARFGGASRPQDLCRVANVATQATAEAFEDLRLRSVFPCDDGFVGPAPTGSLVANRIGLHDTIGNVAEWTWDAYQPEGVDVVPWTPGVPASPAPGARASKVVRGGSWMQDQRYLRVADRTEAQPDWRSPGVGLRLARSAQ